MEIMQNLQKGPCVHRSIPQIKISILLLLLKQTATISIIRTFAKRKNLNQKEYQTVTFVHFKNEGCFYGHKDLFVNFA